MRWLRRGAVALGYTPAGNHSAAFAAHLERWLGPGERVGWEFPNEISVLRYDDVPTVGLATVVTFGLSHHLLASSVGPIREELVAIVKIEQADGDLANRISYEAELIRNRGRAAEPDEVLLIGEPIGARQHLRGGWTSRVHGYEPAFDTVIGADKRFLIVQIVPLSTGEHQRAEAIGGHDFGHEVEPMWSTLLDLDREPLFAPITPPGGFQFAGLADLDVDQVEDRVSPGMVRRLKVGDIAKLRFRVEPVLPTGPLAEQMWVEVDDVDGPEFVGRLTNQPQYLLELHPGDTVTFGERHVLDVRLR